LSKQENGTHGTAFAHLLTIARSPAARRRRKSAKWDTLLAHKETLLEAREKGMSYRRISEELEKGGFPVSYHVIGRFFKFLDEQAGVSLKPAAAALSRKARHRRSQTKSAT